MKPQHINAASFSPAEKHHEEHPDSSSLSEAKLGSVEKSKGKTRRGKRGGRKRNQKQKLQERLFIEHLVEERIKQIRMFMEASQLPPVCNLSVDQISSHLSQIEINPSYASDGDDLKDYEFYCAEEQFSSQMINHTSNSQIYGHAAASSDGYDNVPTNGSDNYGYYYPGNGYYHGDQSGYDCYGYTNDGCGYVTCS